MYGGICNSASVIGKYGNPYEDYVAAFELPLPNDALNLIPVTGNENITAPVPSGYGSNSPDNMAMTIRIVNDDEKSGKIDTHQVSQGQWWQHQPEASNDPQTPPRSEPERRSSMTKLIQNGAVAQGRILSLESQLIESDEEGFLDVLRTVASALPTGLGIIGGPIGAFAGFALSAASAITAERADSAMDEPAIHEGSMERAILAEATLSALQSAELPHDLEESIFRDMKEFVMGALPTIRKAAPHVMGAMMEPALRFTLDSLHDYNQKAAAWAENFEATSPECFKSTVLYSAAIDQPADHQTEAFLGHLRVSLQQSLHESPIEGDSEEGFLDFINATARLTGKGVLAAAQYGLPILVDVIKNSGSAEAFEDQPSSGPAAQLLAADPLAQRALVADAALKAVMMVPPQQLQEAGIFDFLTYGIRTIAPIAMKVAPAVVGAINPTLSKVVSSVLQQESTSTSDSTMLGGIGFRRAGTRGLIAKGSLHTLRGPSAHGNGGRYRSEQAGTNKSRFGMQLVY